MFLTRLVCVWLVCGLLCVTTLGCTPSEPDAQTAVMFHFVDVGQGDASLITSPDGCILIDTGPNTAEVSLKSYLHLCGITRIDCLILTHPHEDHIGGADMILSSFEVGMVIMAGAEENTSSDTENATENITQSPDSTVLSRVREALRRSDCQVLEPVPGLTVSLGGILLTVLGPDPETDTPRKDDNDDSLIVRVRYGNVTALFTGDAGAEVEETLLAQNIYLDSDILKLGHHGSRYSTTEAWLDAVTPDFAVVSAGAGNAYGHPFPEVMARLERRGITCLRTDKGEPVRLVTDGHSVWVQP